MLVCIFSWICFFFFSYLCLWSLAVQIGDEDTDRTSLQSTALMAVTLPYQFAVYCLHSSDTDRTSLQSTAFMAVTLTYQFAVYCLHGSDTALPVCSQLPS